MVKVVCVCASSKLMCELYYDKNSDVCVHMHPHVRVCTHTLSLFISSFMVYINHSVPLHLHTPISPSLISLMVSVDTKHHVYF